MTSALSILGLSNHLADQGRDLSRAQTQTNQSFSFKWAKRDTYESPAMQERAKAWLIERYCDGDPGRVDEWLGNGEKVIVDAGCGSGFSAALLFGDVLNRNHYLGVDSTDAVQVGRQRFAELSLQGDFLCHDLTTLPLPDGSVDLILAEGVLHHTDNTASSLLHLSKSLKKGGKFLFYVYRKKGPVREFTDDLIRQSLSNLTNEEAWAVLLPLTELGRALGDLNVSVDIPMDIPLLEIQSGEHDIQRLCYWHFVKAFYGSDLTIEEMNHINFDWFRPMNCHRHTKEEVESYCDRAGLIIEHMNVQEAGITVVASKGGTRIHRDDSNADMDS